MFAGSPTHSPARKPTPVAYRRIIPLSHDLEVAILSAVLRGYAGSDVVEEQEISKVGRVVLRVTKGLEEEGVKPPYNLYSVQLTAVDVFGAPREEIRRYLAECHRVQAEADVAEVLGRVRDKQVLVSLVNEAATQLGKGALDVGAISALLGSREDSRAPTPVSERIRDGLPEPPRGIPLGSLPGLTKVTGGVYGVWGLAGEPGVGKSTLAWQIALDVGRGIPVIYDDHENGFAVLMDHTREVFEGDLDRIRRATTRLYYCDNARDLDRYLAAVAPPALVIIDSLQKLPASVEYRRQSLDRWIHRLELLKKRGYHVLLVSEVPRTLYGGEPNIAAFKETGEVEYAADLGLQIMGTEGDAALVYVIKNRHHPHKGYVCTLRRERSWWFKEE